MSILKQVALAMTAKINARLMQATGQPYTFNADKLEMDSDVKAHLEINDLCVVNLTLDERNRTLKVEIHGDDGEGPLLAPAIWSYILNSAVTAIVRGCACK